MFSFVNKLTQLWKDYGFELILVLALIFLFIYWLCRLGKQGTYSESVSFSLPIRSQHRSSPLPRESKGEKRCREILEHLFNKPFPKVRPDFLCNPITKDYNLELDCYNSDLKLGLEYNGKQHYEYCSFIHKNRDAFRTQQYRDYLTVDLCKKHGVKLIVVPYTVKHEDLERYIRDELKKIGF